MSEDSKRFDFNDKEAREKLVADLRQSMKELQEEMRIQDEREKNDPPDRIRHEYDSIFWCPKVDEYWIKDEKEPAAKIEMGWYAGCSEEETKKIMECEDNPEDNRNIMIIGYDMIPDLIQELQKIYDDNKDIK
jgi:hypothetical protein